MFSEARNVGNRSKPMIKKHSINVLEYIHISYETTNLALFRWLNDSTTKTTLNLWLHMKCVYILTHNFLLKKVYLYKFFVLDKTTPSFRSTSGTHSVKKNPVKQPS